MKIPALKAENVQGLRKLVTQVPTEIRDAARAERRRLIQMDREMPDYSSFAITRGALNSNQRLAKVVDELKTKNASSFYQRQPMGEIVNPPKVAEQKRSLQYVSASMAEETANSQIENDYLAKELLK